MYNLLGICILLLVILHFFMMVIKGCVVLHTHSLREGRSFDIWYIQPWPLVYKEFLNKPYVNTYLKGLDLLMP